MASPRFETLLDHLLDERDCFEAAVRLSEAVRRAGAPLDTVGAAARNALSNPATTVRRSAAWLLGELRCAGALELLLRAVEDASEDIEVRRNAAGALGRIGREEALETLARALRTKALRQNAAIALGAIGTPRCLEMLLALLGEADASVREGAVWALAELGSPESAEPLRRAMQDSSPSVRGAATWALSRMKSKGLRPGPLRRSDPPRFL